MQDQHKVQRDIQRLQEETHRLQLQIRDMQADLKQGSTDTTSSLSPDGTALSKKGNKETKKTKGYHVHTSNVTVHSLNADPESLEFYPTALIADGHVVTYIAGTPIVTSPYLGSRPAFDGSDYIVNISSINRDIRLLEQRRRLYQAYERVGYPAPQVPILAFSGKVSPLVTVGDPFVARGSGDISLGSNELDLAAILNKNVEAYMSLVYDDAPPDVGGQRLSNSSIDLNMGFVNIGNLNNTPFYFTGGQLFAPFGRFSSAMVSAPLTMIMARTKTRPFIFGYKSKRDSGPFAALYGFKSDTTSGESGVGGFNLGYTFQQPTFSGEIGGSVISSIDDAGGMQFTGSVPGTTFGGFSSFTNGNEAVHKIPAVGVHGYVNVDRYSITAEWVGTTNPFRARDLSYMGHGALPQSAQLELGMTFKAFDKPSSVALGYQWSQEALALNLPAQRWAGVFNMSIWKDTVESLEYRHDINYGQQTYANGAAPSGHVNANTYGSGGSSDTLLAQIAVFF